MLIAPIAPIVTPELTAARGAYQALTLAYNNLVDDEAGEPPFAPRLLRARAAAVDAIGLLTPFAASTGAANAIRHARDGITLLDSVLVTPEPRRKVIEPIIQQATGRMDAGLEALLGGYDLFG